MNWVPYLTSVNFTLGLWYCAYALAFRGETFHQANRYWLLLGAVVALFVPFSPKELLQSIAWLVDLKTQFYTIYHPQAWLATTLGTLRWGHLLAFLYLFGVLVVLGWLALGLTELQTLLRAKSLKTSRSKQAFALGQHWFVGKNVAHRATVVAHERTHVKQLHTADILLVDLLAIFNWFNPFVFFLRKSLLLLHEFLADEAASRHELSRVAYARLLVQQTFGSSGGEFSHAFFPENNLKARVKMLSRPASSPQKRWKYLLGVPLLVLAWIFSFLVCG